MFSSEKPAMLANLHCIYTDLLPLKYFLLKVSYIILVFEKLTKHHSILEPFWKSLTNLKIIPSLCFLIVTEKTQNGKNGMEEL